VERAELAEFTAAAAVTSPDSKYSQTAANLSEHFSSACVIPFDQCEAAAVQQTGEQTVMTVDAK